MRKIALVASILVTLVALVLAGCARSSTAPAPAPTPAPTPAPAPAPTPTPTPEATSSLPTMPADFAKVKTVKGDVNPYWGLGFKPDGTPYKFDVVIIDMSNEAWATFGWLGEAQLKASGANVTLAQSGLDVGKQVAAIEDSVRGGADAILLHPFDAAGTGPAVDFAKSKGVGVFTVDTPSYSDGQVFLCRMDNYKKGLIGGQEMVRIAEANNTELVVLKLLCPLSFEICNQRAQGFDDAIAGANVTVAQSIDMQAQDQLAMNAVADVLPAHPEINAVWSGGGGIDGTIQGLKNVDKWFPIGDPKHIVYVATDDFPASIEACRDGYIEGMPPCGAWEMLDCAVKALLKSTVLGQSVPKELNPITDIITKETLDKPLYGQQYVWGEQVIKVKDWYAWPILDTTNIGMSTPTYQELLQIRGQ